MNFISRRKNQGDLVNEAIRFKEVLVIGPEGEQFGILTRNEALDKAEEYNLDLFCVSPGATPPVCKIMDYGRHRYEQQKRAREAKKKQHVTQVKSLRLSPVIEDHDFNTRLRQARNFLEKGFKVKIDMRFRGRMMTRVEVGTKTMNRFLDETQDLGTAENRPKLEGNTMSVVISPTKKK